MLVGCWRKGGQSESFGGGWIGYVGANGRSPSLI